MLSISPDDLKSQPFWIILISCLGFLTLLRNFVTFVKWIYCIHLRPDIDLVSKYGSWALITGATDGIGKAFAFELAEKGLNLVLVSRDLRKLEDVSDEIRERHPEVKVRVFQVDFSGKDVAARVTAMEEFTKKLEIGVLINNVGVTYPSAMFFHDVEEKTWMNLVRVNVEGTSHVTRAVLPGMVARRRGAVVNIGSGASVVVPSHPLFAIYAATKAYVDQLSRSLHVEYRELGIDVQCQVPLYVTTKMATRVAFVEKPSLFIPTAEKYAEAAVRCIGRRGGVSRCTPYWAHSAQWFLASLMPEAWLDEWRFWVGIRRMKLVHH